eukprot:Em0013g44a
MKQLPHWESVDMKLDPTPDATLGLARASHSVLVWMDHMIVYGGYWFLGGNDTKAGNGSVSLMSSPQLLRYHLRHQTWEGLVSDEVIEPEPRYGHTSVVYNDTMYVFGGTKVLSEEMTNELWALDLTTMTWALIETNNSSTAFLPIPVRSHTAHVVGSKMVVMLGMTSLEDSTVSLVQEFDFITETWSLPVQRGSESARMGHSSVYSTKTGLIYVYVAKSGHSSKRHFRFYLHSVVLIGDLLLAYGGCGDTSPTCFQSTLHVYNIVCGQWMNDTLVKYPGLPGSARRYGHSSVLDSSNSSVLVFGGFNGLILGDMFKLVIGNCDMFKSVQDCGNGSVFCGWSASKNQCISTIEASVDTSYNCRRDECIGHQSCGGCEALPNCTWSVEASVCMHTATKTMAKDCTAAAIPACPDYTTCLSCFSHGCDWSGTKCVPRNVSSPLVPRCTAEACAARTCQSCVSSSCLWCPSLQKCLSNYPLTFPYGQCLGWAKSCPATCASYQTCSKCTADSRCGWCSDSSNTGLGTCSEGGFYSSSSCPSNSWYFDQCPLCQCNGYSSCYTDSSTCIQCQNRTTGNQCQYCQDTYYGDPANGQNTCTSCNCNLYNPTCDNRTGSCDCMDTGVAGNKCTQCAAGHGGDAFNFCYDVLSVGYIYTFETDSKTKLTQTYYVVAAEGEVLNFQFEVTDNPLKNDIILQLFLGRASQKFYLLYPVSYYTIHQTGSYSISLPNDTSSSSHNDSLLYTFARPSITNTANFSLLRSLASSSDYTESLWNGDVKLVVYISGLSSGCVYKISVDNQSYWVLLYFFASFTGCFAVLLMIFIAGWYVRRRIAIRAFMRQQYVELQRRVSRPFARVKLEIDKTSQLSAPQMASYAAVEILRDGRAGILTVFVKLPGNQSTNKPNPGRTGICLGSTLVKLNPSKREKRAKQQRTSHSHVTTNF